MIESPTESAPSGKPTRAQHLPERTLRNHFRAVERGSDQLVGVEDVISSQVGAGQPIARVSPDLSLEREHLPLAFASRHQRRASTDTRLYRGANDQGSRPWCSYSAADAVKALDRARQGDVAQAAPCR